MRFPVQTLATLGLAALIAATASGAPPPPPAVLPSVALPPELDRVLHNSNRRPDAPEPADSSLDEFAPRGRAGRWSGRLDVDRGHR
jgi:hypothetical protein